MTRHSHQLCSTIQKHGLWANYIETTFHNCCGKMSVAGLVVVVVQPFRLTLQYMEVSHSIKRGRHCYSVLCAIERDTIKPQSGFNSFLMFS